MSSKKQHVGVDLGLTEEEKKELHRIAWTVIENKTCGKAVPATIPSTEKLKENRGAFVCIHKKGMLRGCIGSLEARTPLHKTVEEMAEAAAFRDPRFRPLTPEELPYVEVEISVLTPFEKLDNPEDLQVGHHGIIIRKAGRSGLLLPQVAAERDWDKETFLRETCRKAGLPGDAWKDKETEIFVFSADVF